MKLWSSLVFGFVSLFLVSSLISADFYKWTDEKGGLHFSGSLSEVPTRYRNQITGGEFKEKPSQKITPSHHKKAIHREKLFKKYSVPYKAREASTSRVIIDVTFNGKVTVPMLLDTGAGEVIISETLAKKLGIFKSDVPKLKVSVSGIGGAAPAFRTILNSMEIGRLKTEFIPTKIVSPLSKVFDGIVGMNFMSQYHFRVDPVERTVIFEEFDSGHPHYGGYEERWWRRYFAEFSAYLNQTKRQVDVLERYLGEHTEAYISVRKAVKKELLNANAQHQEAEKLLTRLNGYASLNAVPISWRRRRH